MQRMSRESDFARAELEHLAAGEPSAFIALAPGRRAAASVPTRSTSALRLASGLRPLPSGSGRPDRLPGLDALLDSGGSPSTALGSGSGLPALCGCLAAPNATANKPSQVATASASANSQVPSDL